MPRSLVFAAAAAAVVLLAVMMTNRREPAPIVQTAAAPIPSPAPASEIPSSEQAPIAEARPSMTQTTAPPENVEPHDQTQPTGIAALTPPDSLTVEHLAIPHLAIDAVEVERLEVPTLQIAALALADEDKE